MFGNSNSNSVFDIGNNSLGSLGLNRNNWFEDKKELNHGMRIKKFFGFKSGRMKENFQRPHELNMDIAGENRFRNMWQESQALNPGGLFNKTQLASELSSVIGLSSRVCNTAYIPNGWNSERIIFILVIELPLETFTQEFYIQGYCDTDGGISFNNNFNPNTIFYINSITNVRKTKVQSPFGGIVEQAHVSETYNVINSMFGGAYEEVSVKDNGLKFLRPVDIFTEALTVNPSNSQGTIYNNIGNVSSTSETSKKSNNDPIEYIGNLLNPLIQAKASSEFGYDNKDTYYNALINCKESITGKNPFIYAMGNITNRVSPTMFTFEELKVFNNGYNIDFHIMTNMSQGYGELNHNNMSTIRSGMIGNFKDAGIFNMSDNQQETITCITANKLTQSLNAIMSKNLVSELAVTITNHGSVIMRVNSFIDGLSDNDLIRYGNIIKAHIDTVLIPDITLQGQFDVNVDFYSELLTTTTVAIAINTGSFGTTREKEIFQFGTFADSMFSPVVGDMTAKTNIVEQATNMFQIIQ